MNVSRAAAKLAKACNPELSAVPSLECGAVAFEVIDGWHKTGTTPGRRMIDQ